MFDDGRSDDGPARSLLVSKRAGWPYFRRDGSVGVYDLCWTTIGLWKDQQARSWMRRAQYSGVKFGDFSGGLRLPGWCRVTARGGGSVRVLTSYSGNSRAFPLAAAVCALIYSALTAVLCTYLPRASVAIGYGVLCYAVTGCVLSTIGVYGVLTVGLSCRPDATLKH